MPNYSFYDVHIRADDKAAWMIAHLLPDAFEDKRIVHVRTDNGVHVLHVSGECPWSLDHGRTDLCDGINADLSAFRAEDLREGTVDPASLPYAHLSLRALSAVFHCELQACELCPENQAYTYTHCKDGKILTQAVDEGEWLTWDKTVHPTLNDLYASLGIDPEDAPDEEDFAEDGENVWGCLYFKTPMPFDF